MQKTEVAGPVVIVTMRNGEVQKHTFATEAEALARAAFVAEAVSWIGTPFRDCADIKGRAGAVDCAMLLTRCAVDTGLVPPFDPRPYPPRWHLHQSRERFIEWIEGTFRATPVDVPRLGDVAVFKFGKCFSHGAILANSDEFVHAWYAAQSCMLSRRDEPLLTNIPLLGARPVRYYDFWSGRA